MPDNINFPKSHTALGKTFHEIAKELFDNLYDEQVSFQQMLLDTGKYDNFTDNPNEKLPVDDIRLFSYHVQQIVSEIGEVLAADKRWKSHRSDTSQEMLEHKKEELADILIVFMNLCIFSGISSKEILGAVARKINENYIRIKSK